MEKDCYQEIIEEVSRKLAEKMTSEEENLVERSTLIDGDIAGIVQSIGLKTTQRVLENTRDEIIRKKTGKSDNSSKSNNT